MDWILLLSKLHSHEIFDLQDFEIDFFFDEHSSLKTEGMSYNGIIRYMIGCEIIWLQGLVIVYNFPIMLLRISISVNVNFTFGLWWKFLHNSIHEQNSELRIYKEYLNSHYFLYNSLYSFYIGGACYFIHYGTFYFILIQTIIYSTRQSTINITSQSSSLSIQSKHNN